MLFGRTLLLLFVVWSCEGNFWETTGDVNERFQKVPTVAKTREKIMKYLLKRKNVHRQRRLTPYHDIVFAFDSSSDISQKDFKLTISAAKKLIRRFEPDTLFSSVSFAAKTVINSNFSSPQTAIKKLEDLTNQGGTKNITAALRTIGNELFFNRRSGVRNGSDKSVLLMTSGPAEELHDDRELQRFLISIYNFKAQGNEVFLVAAGGRIPRIQELVEIPSSTNDHFYRVFDMMQFKQIVDSIPEHIVYRELGMME